MELKNILSKINQTPEKPENFFAIEIGHEVIKTAVWNVTDKITQIVSIGSIEEWSKNSEDSLLEAIDASLSVCSEGQPEDINKVIFGLPETWVGLDGIVDSKKSYLKNITKKLELKPVGFVVTTEAIIHHLRIKEGGPPSVILISLTESEAVISLVVVGEVLGTQAVGRSDDLSKDVEEGLARFSDVKDFPTRMIVYDGNINLDQAKQTLISYDWQSSDSFLHFPKIEDLSPKSTIRAIAIAGGTEVAKSLGIKVEEPPIEEEKETKKEPTETKLQEATAEDFGFSDPTTNLTEEEPPKDFTSGDNFEKVEDESTITNDSPTTKTTKDEVEELETTKEELELKDEPVSTRRGGPKKKFALKLKLPNIKRPKILNKLKFKKLPFPPVLVIGGVLLILLFSAGFFAYWNLPKAEVTIHISPKSIEKEISFNLDPNADILNTEESTIPAQKENIQLEGEKEAATTGTALVGERATGTVNIFNLTDYEKTFDSGDIIKFDTLEFTLNEAVTIASASSTVDASYQKITTPTQESVKVTAADIGDQYNFSSGTELYVENYDKSSFVAKASTDFTGGFAREVQAVSSDDQDSLKEALLSELKQQGIDNLSVEASQEKMIVEIDEEEILKESYSADIGDEQDSLRLALQFKVPIYSYHQKDLTMMIEKNYSDEIPDNFSIDSEKLSLEIIGTEILDSDTVSVTANAKLQLTPNLNEEEIKNTIRGKYPELTKDYFSNIPNFDKVETSFNFPLPSKLKTFPRKTENITIKIQVD